MARRFALEQYDFDRTVWPAIQKAHKLPGSYRRLVEGDGEDKANWEMGKIFQRATVAALKDMIDLAWDKIEGKTGLRPYCKLEKRGDAGVQGVVTIPRRTLFAPWLAQLKKRGFDFDASVLEDLAKNKRQYLDGLLWELDESKYRKNLYWTPSKAEINTLWQGDKPRDIPILLHVQEFHYDPKGNFPAEFFGRVRFGVERNWGDTRFGREKTMMNRMADRAMTTAVLYEPGKRGRAIAPDNGTDFSLKELQEFVGGYIEMINLRGTEVMIVNEEGMLRRMKPNREASKIAGQPIVGPAVVMDEAMLQ